MKKWVKRWSMTILSLVILCGIGMPVRAASDPTLKEGVLIQGMDLSGMHRQEAADAVEQYIDSTLR
ncbi:MAG: hypothetical protein K2H12_05060, partial [Acetatifactor sp.]|nr:hypothetical protein [Acetatifactor sp.]